MRAVLDPGVLISALLSRSGAPAHLLLAWLGGRFELLVSPSLLDELRTVLLRKKFRRWFTEESALAYLDLLERIATQVGDPGPDPGATRDPKDDYLVALSRRSRAHALVSGDNDLLEAGVRRPPVISPRAFLELLEAPSR